AFVALVGASGSVLRAAAMAQLALVGWATARTAGAGGLLLWGSAFLAAWPRSSNRSSLSRRPPW
ncbi:MAG TPA: hypothetical protein VHN78_13260, partial [Chloroflexota bacterium]|nr:hypothetical protein [Chloroflexota bacterium]